MFVGFGIVLLHFFNHLLDVSFLFNEVLVGTREVTIEESASLCVDDVQTFVRLLVYISLKLFSTVA